MKKKVKIISILLLITILSSFFIYTKTNKEYIINKTLKNKYYSYLPKEAKAYIKEVYEKTGEIIDTEKNKKENIPYLSPKYVEYLTLSKSEQEKVSEIPTQYDIYFDSEETSDELPATFDLRNVNGNNYITNLKNQSTLNICWDFTSVEQTESNLMIKQGTPRDLTFSVRQIDYASSTDGIKDYDNENGVRTLTSGGNFLVSSAILYNGLGLHNDSLMPFNTSINQKEVSEVLNYTNSLYELNSSVLMPTMDSQSTEEQWDNYINNLKQLIMENGGAYVGTQAPGYSCSSLNPNDNNNSTIIKVDGICEEDGNHAMQIIGWDDNYEYSYCQSKCLDSSSQPTISCHKNNVSTCNSENKVTGKGAWILRNSWGNSDAYIYLAYGSLEDDVYIFKDFSSTESKTWDNNYHKKLDPTYVSLPTTDTQTFQKDNNSEKLEKIKVFTYGKNGIFNISVKTNSHNYNIVKQETLPNMGINTIDLSDSNIILNDSEFEITIESTNNVRLIEKSMSIFTSNVSKDPIIDSGITGNHINLDLSNNDYSLRILSKTKNIPSGSIINYSLTDGQENDESNYLSVQNNIVAVNNVNTSLKILASIKPGLHTLTISYQNTSEEIGITIGEGKANIYFYANDGTDNYITQRANFQESFNLQANQFTRDGYSFGGWNTKADGLGESYTDSQTIEGLENDLTLYAVWIPNKYTISFDPNGGLGEMESQEYTYDTPLQLQPNQFEREGYYFKSWNTKANGTGDIYVNNQTINLLNKNITLYAQWEKKTVNISYNANSGTGYMYSQETVYGESLRAKYNSFIKEGYSFKEWNTSSDGSGQSYNENQVIENITSNMTLYAQWNPIEYTVIFNSNGGTGNMAPQVFTYDVEQQLQENTFTNQQYEFASWNTKADGTGTFYQNTQSIMNLTSNSNTQIKLYAMWNKAPDVYYKTHVQNDGWQNYVTNGRTSGTEGRSLRLEAIKIKVLNKAYDGSIEYITHIQNEGWEKYFRSNDAVSGTSGKSLRLEGIEIKLTGELANHYDIYYQVHAENFGWLGWAKNGEDAGTAGYSYRLEAIKIKIVKKDEVFADYGKKDPFKGKTQYQTHIQYEGWQDYKKDGEMSGTSGRSLRLEGIKIKTNIKAYQGDIEYQTHIQNIGWEDKYHKNGEMSGTSGKSLRLEGIRIRLTGDLANHYDVYYRVHAENFGWLSWAKNGEDAGTEGYAYRLEGIEIVIVKKGQSPPKRTNTNNVRAFIKK